MYSHTVFGVAAKLLVSADAEPGATLVERERQKAEFLRLVNEVRPVLSRVALRLAAGNTAVAEDCVQDAVVAAYRAYMAGAFKDRGRFRGWMITILTNCFLVDHRKAKRTVATGDIDRIIEARQGAGPLAPDGTDALGEALIEALATLSEEQRACVLLVDMHEEDYGQAAKILGVPVGTVRSRLHRARLTMARHLLARQGRRSDP